MFRLTTVSSILDLVSNSPKIEQPSFSFYNGSAMASSCKDKDGAWSFIRQVLLPQEEESGRGRYYYSARNFSVNKADFDKAVEMALIHAASSAVRPFLIR